LKARKGLLIFIKNQFMPENKNTSGNGLGIGTIIFLIFLTLKLAEIGPVAHWSWLWVFSPLWIPLALIGVLAIIAFILMMFNK